MSAITLLLGSIFLFLGIILSLDAKELHMLGFREEGEWATRLAMAMTILGFVLWTAGSPGHETRSVVSEPLMSS
jgi:hypothetical protein